MSNFYQVISGNIEGSKTEKSYLIEKYKFLLVLFQVISICLAMLFTYKIFTICISEKNLENTISLGSIFATFGSAIVAVVSVYCNDSYVRFSDNVGILQTELLKDEHWTRWTFVKRKSKRRLLDNGIYEQILQNAKIKFSLGSHDIYKYVPTVRADFDDLPIFRQLILMKRYSKQYETNLCNHASPDDAVAFFIWDCIFDIYVQIAYYKICTYVIWIGCSFVFSSLVCAFVYIYI